MEALECMMRSGDARLPDGNANLRKSASFRHFEAPRRGAVTRTTGPDRLLDAGHASCAAISPFVRLPLRLSSSCK